MRIAAPLASVLGLVCISFLPSLSQAQTCAVVGQSGVAPVATLTFTAPTSNTDGTPIATPLTYNLWQGTAPGKETLVGSGLMGSPIQVKTGLASGTTYFWYITVTDAHGITSVPSNEGCKQFPPSAPDTLTITIT